MRSNHLFVLVAVASVLTQPAVGASHGRPTAPSASVPAAPKLCRMFDSPTWDNQGFVVACDNQAPNAGPPARRCSMFNSSAYDMAGFNVLCERETVAASTPQQRTCPVFSPSTWDNMGFRVPC